MRFLALVAFLLSALPAAAGTERLTFEMGGLKREMYLTVPDGLAGPAPLVLVIHGLFQSGAGMRRATRHRFDELAARYGFVVAYPSAYLRVWNPGGAAPPLPPPRDDLAYLEKVIAIARARAPIDGSRIFSAGFSQGGMMSYALACTRPGLIRAIASFSMPLPAFFADACRAHPPEGVLIAHGTDDPIVPFAGGSIISGPHAHVQLMGFDATVAFFTRARGCAAPGKVQSYDAVDDGTSVIRRVWTRCRSGAVEAFRIVHGGHRWPSGGPDLPVIGITTREIDGANAAWGFFSRFPTATWR